MCQQVETHAGAVALDVRPDVPVQLRLSALDRLCVVLRWTFTLAGLVVVLWFGAAFLAASPASAVVPITAASTGLVKGGTSRPAGGKNGNSGSGTTTDTTSESTTANTKKPAATTETKKPAATTETKKPAATTDAKKAAAAANAKKTTRLPAPRTVTRPERRTRTTAGFASSR
jgi:cytoskeletal protein RodZ